MLTVQVDEGKVKELYAQKIEEKLKEYDADMVFWDTNELKRRTCMSWSSIQERFFFDPRFPKFKVGQKWMFPAYEAKQFLLNWLKEQPKS